MRGKLSVMDGRGGFDRVRVGGSQVNTSLLVCEEVGGCSVPCQDEKNHAHGWLARKLVAELDSSV